MSTYTDASLIVTPNAKKAGKLYSLKGADLDVVRATSPTRVNEQGLVEIPRTNLVLRSKEFDNASWTKTASTVTANATTSPSGVQDADKLVEDTTNNQHRIDQTTTSAVGTNTFSIFAKKAERDFIWLRIGAVGAYFDLTNGTFSGLTGGVTASIQSYPNGWYRCAITLTSATANEIIRINLATSVGGGTYLGNGTSGIYIWGAQLEVGDVATEYIPTTSVIRTRFAGITQDGGSASNIPRLDYTNGSCPSILVEPQRTNLLLRSEEFDNASWVKTNSTITANSTTSPSGTMTADKLVENNTNTSHFILQSTGSLVIGNTYKISIAYN